MKGRQAWQYRVVQCKARQTGRARQCRAGQGRAGKGKAGQAV